MFRNIVLVELLRDSRLKNNESDYDVSKNHQNVFTNTIDNPLKKLNDINRVQYENF